MKPASKVHDSFSNGFFCAGCGLQRALHEFFQGHWYAAFRLNAFFTLALLLLLVDCLLLISNWRNGGLCLTYLKIIPCCFSLHRYWLCLWYFETFPWSHSPSLRQKNKTSTFGL
ncbi:MAG: DUF2752 domain-containing protein [Flavobacteriia bacterium]|nr:DUF2752 domain-containing protein [Flavobacteriia bacterium]